ncbi:hypothetical protein E4T56_gene10873 [Termitomyces sp. T112]|nr:hypothetical protein E4T56_gene10873 [Termitomyces sp. T112]
MSVFNPTYNPAGYPTDAYGQPLLENPYAPFYPGPFADQHSTPPPSAREYPQAGAALPHSMLMAIIPVLTPENTLQHPPTPPTFPPPITMRIQSPLQPQSLWSPWITIPPRPPFATQTPPSPRQQRVKAYAQQHDEVLRFLHLFPVEFARHTCTLLTNLGYPDASTTPEVWADRLLDFHERYLQGNLPENMQGTLGINDNLRNELRALQEELNAASSILRNLNPTGGSVPSAFQTWDQPAAPELRSQQPPLRVDDNNRTLSYIDKPGNPADEHAPRNGPQRDRPPHFNLRVPRINAPPPCPNAPVPPQQPMGPGAPRPPFFANPSRPPPAPMPNPPTNANYFGPPTPRGPPPP